MPFEALETKKLPGGDMCLLACSPATSATLLLSWPGALAALHGNWKMCWRGQRY